MGKSTAKDNWDPAQYRRFEAERKQPFVDLLALVQPTPGGHVIDLGCGTGELTAELHEHVNAAHTLGVDKSPAMLAEAKPVTGVHLEERDVATPPSNEMYDVVFSNACLQWVPDHLDVIRRWSTTIRPGGQIAIQVPANSDHPSHTVAARVASSAEFADAFGGTAPPDPVRSIHPPEVYAELLHELGFVEQHVRLQIYGHVLDSSSDVVEWVKGTSLTRFKPALGDRFEHFIDVYRRELLDVIGDRQPYFYAFKRILLWGRRESRA